MSVLSTSDYRLINTSQISYAPINMNAPFHPQTLRVRHDIEYTNMQTIKFSAITKPNLRSQNHLHTRCPRKDKACFYSTRAISYGMCIVIIWVRAYDMCRSYWLAIWNIDICELRRCELHVHSQSTRADECKKAIWDDILHGY